MKTIWKFRVPESRPVRGFLISSTAHFNAGRSEFSWVMFPAKSRAGTTMHANWNWLARVQASKMWVEPWQWPWTCARMARTCCDQILCAYVDADGCTSPAENQQTSLSAPATFNLINAECFDKAAAKNIISARRETKPASESLAENYLLKIVKTRHILYVSNRFVNDLRRNLK